MRKRERKGSEEVHSRGFIAVQNTVGKGKKKLFQKVPEGLKTSLCIMPMKQVSTSLFKLDQDDKNRETKWWKPLLSSSASPHAKGRLLKAQEMIQILQMKSGEQKAYSWGSLQETQCLASFSKKPVQDP